MRFEKHIYQINTYKIGENLFTGKAPASPILNSCYGGSFIAGIAYLRYLKAKVSCPHPDRKQMQGLHSARNNHYL